MPTRTVLLRPATLDDLDAIAGIELAAAHGPWPRGSIASTLAVPTTRAFVCVEQDQVVGHVLAASVADQGEILILAVHPQAQRLGLARRLLAAVDEAWRADGVTRVWLEVRVDNLPARRLYESLGWAEEGIRRAYYDDGTDAAVLSRCP